MANQIKQVPSVNNKDDERGGEGGKKANRKLFWHYLLCLYAFAAMVIRFCVTRVQWAANLRRKSWRRKAGLSQGGKWINRWEAMNKHGFFGSACLQCLPGCGRRSNLNLKSVVSVHAGRKHVLLVVSPPQPPQSTSIPAFFCDLVQPLPFFSFSASDCPLRTILNAFRNKFNPNYTRNEVE